MENKRRKVHEELEVVKVGYANGVAEGFPFTDKQKLKMISNAEKAYGKFLDALKCSGRLSFVIGIYFMPDVVPEVIAK